MLHMRPLVLAALFGTLLHGAADITIPLDGGTIVLIDPQFIRVVGKGTMALYIPELSFKIRNQTSSPWTTLKLQFEIVGVCGGETRQWSRSAIMNLRWAKESVYIAEYKDPPDLVAPLIGKVDGCQAETFKAALVLAESPIVRIDGLTGERVDLVAQREAEAAKRAKEEAALAAMRAKADAVRRRVEAEEQARDAEEGRKVRAACTAIYKSTADKRMGDLTVKEDQQVKACQALGLYPPR